MDLWVPYFHIAVTAPLLIKYNNNMRRGRISIEIWPRPIIIIIIMCRKWKSLEGPHKGVPRGP